jgi:hypothetical protein
MLETLARLRRAESSGAGRRCPGCHGDIGIAPTLFLYLNRLTCPGCGLRLRYDETFKIVFLKLVLLVATVSLVVAVATRVPAGLRLLWWLVLAFLWLGLEAVGGMILRRRRTLQVRH